MIALDGWDDVPKDIVIVGGGYTGVELACNLKRKRPGDAVTLWDRGDALVPNAAAGNRAAAEKALDAAGVAVKLGAAYDGAAEQWVFGADDKMTKSQWCC